MAFHGILFVLLVLPGLVRAWTVAPRSLSELSVQPDSLVIAPGEPFRLHLSNARGSQLRVSLIDALSGDILIRQTPASAEEEIFLDAGVLPAGIYQVIVHDDVAAATSQIAVIGPVSRGASTLFVIDDIASPGLLKRLARQVQADEALAEVVRDQDPAVPVLYPNELPESRFAEWLFAQGYWRDMTIIGASDINSWFLGKYRTVLMPSCLPILKEQSLEALLAARARNLLFFGGLLARATLNKHGFLEVETGQDCSLPERNVGPNWDHPSPGTELFPFNSPAYIVEDGILHDLGWRNPLDPAPENLRVRSSWVPHGFGFEEGNPLVLAIGPGLPPMRASFPQAHFVQGSTTRFFAGIEGWGELLLTGREPWVMLTRYLLERCEVRRSALPDPPQYPASQYGGLYQSFHTREIGGPVSLLGYRKPGVEGGVPELASKWANSDTKLGDQGRSGDLVPQDGFWTRQWYIPPSAAADMVSPRISWGGGPDSPPWPLVRVVGRGKVSSVREFRPFIDLHYDESDLHVTASLPYPPLSLSFMAIYQKNFRGKPLILAGGTSRAIVSTDGPTPLRFEAALFHTYGLDRIREVAVLRDDEFLFALNDRGRDGDRFAGDGVYSRGVTIRPGLPPGDLRFQIAAEDTNGVEADPWPALKTHRGMFLFVPSDEALPKLRQFFADRHDESVLAHLRRTWTTVLIPLAAGFLGFGVLVRYGWKMAARR